MESIPAKETYRDEPMQKAPQQKLRRSAVLAGNDADAKGGAVGIGGLFEQFGFIPSVGEEVADREKGNLHDPMGELLQQVFAGGGKQVLFTQSPGSVGIPFGDGYS